jgi:zinc and cadmium transporter
VIVWPAALGLSVAGSVGGLVVASILLAFHRDVRDRVVPWLVSYAVGSLLGAALLGLMPEALERLPPATALGTLLAGILTFFILEKLVLWRHCHDADECTVHRSTATLIIIGDAVHTLVDGVVIAAAVLISPALGVATAFAVIAHEVPQEAGDFAVLLSAGYSRTRALILNLSSAAGGLLGATGMLLFADDAPRLVPFVLAFAAGNFMYVAMADLIPTLHRGQLDSNATRQVTLVTLGILTIWAL